MSAPIATTVSLAGGLRDDTGAGHFAASLRPPTGADEVALADEVETLPLPHLVTALLVRCLVGIGPERPASADVVRRLTVGDRERLLLHLRRMLFGDVMDCVLDCPSCAAPLDLALRVSDLLLPVEPRPGPIEEATLELGGKSVQIRFRLPNGEDQEWAADQPRHSDPARLASTLLLRCVDRVTVDGDEFSPDRWPPELPGELELLMTKLDPLAEIRLEAACPACGLPFSALFDAAAFLQQELLRRSRRLLFEVHRLALSYHWSESEILGLPSRRRQQYLDLLDRAPSP